MVSESSVYGEDIDRVREFFSDGKPHFPKELINISRHGHTYLKKLFYQNFLLRTRDLLNYNYVEVHGKRAKWCRIRGYMYIKSDSPLLGSNRTVEWEFKSTEALTMKTTTERQLLQFITYQESLILQKDHYKRVVSRRQILEYFQKRGIGATLTIIAEDLNLDSTKVSTCLYQMVRRGDLVQKGKWNPFLGRETLFRGRLHGYVYGLTPEQCERFIKSGEVLTAEANAILKEVMKNSNERRLTPLHIFANAPYNFDPSSVAYHSDVLASAFKNIIKMGSKTGQVFLYDSEKLTEEDVKREIEYWDQRLSIKKSAGIVIGVMHEKIVQMCLDEMSKDLTFDWKFLSVVRSGRISFQIRISSGHEIDRILLVSMSPLGGEHYYPIEAKYLRTGVVSAHVLKFYDSLRNSHEYGCSIEHNGQEVRVLKANVTPVIVSPKISDEARKWALSRGMIILPTWKITQYYSKKHGLKPIKIRELVDEYFNRTSEKLTIDQFLQNKLKVN